MANGLVGSLVLPNSSLNLVGTLSLNCISAKADITLTNPTASDITVQVALSANGLSAPNPDDYIEKGVVVAANGGGYSKTDIKCRPGTKVFVLGALNMIARVDAEYKLSST